MYNEEDVEERITVNLCVFECAMTGKQDLSGK